MVSDETKPAVDKAREMLRLGIDIQATGEATNAIVTGVIQSLLDHIEELDADLKTAIAVGRLAAGTDQPNESREEMLRRELAAMNDACSRSDAEVMRLRAATASFDATARLCAFIEIGTPSTGLAVGEHVMKLGQKGAQMVWIARNSYEKALFNELQGLLAALAAPQPTARPDRDVLERIVAAFTGRSSGEIAMWQIAKAALAVEPETQQPKQRGTESGIVNFIPMDIDTPPGTMVRFLGFNGTEGDQRHAREHLVVDQTYRVLRTEIGGWRTEVYFYEVPDECFNSVMFQCGASEPEREGK